MASNASASQMTASALLSVHATSDTKYDEVSTTSANPPESVERHPEFFFEDKLVAIQVEGTLFNVHKHQLTKSEVFSDMFKMPRIQGPEEGSTPEHPIVIKGVAAADFVALLKVLYASHFSSNPPAPTAALMIPAFRLANMWNFSELRTYLIPLAEKHLDDVDKIVFAREFGIKEWLTSAHIRLSQREEYLTTEEARKLEVDSVLLISRMREKYRTERGKWPFPPNSYYCAGCSGLTNATTGAYYACDECGTSSRNPLRCLNPNSALAQKMSGPSTVDTTSLEEEVNKWVEDEYSTKK
ncbi:unnamed protein product [Rhizoctonia solani]|uniref:BTB domain-containing protein n=1 Tax=Rhizoctonia solani TaxID=456999 RepID=A0A8H3HR35_9AGAM|nr:unnamed protein product [Rhizoctonia solani]